MMHLLSEFEIQYLSPIHHSYPAWPGGERWLQLYQTDTNTQVVITKGLNDGESHPYEIYLETNDEIATENFSNSWQANLVYEFGKIVPNVHDLAERIKQYKYLVVQIEMDGAPPEWSIEDANGNIGLFIGLYNPLMGEFTKAFIPLSIKLMRPQELLYTIKNGEAGRHQLAALYLQKNHPVISNLERESVV
jgi:hypothetical protein